MSSARSCVASLLLAVWVAACAQSPEPAATQAPPSAPAQPAAAAGVGNDATVAPTISDADIPPLPDTPFPAARPMAIVRAVYVFAAKHPEVLNQVPCFCGCEHRGHRHNDDCFVAARDARGRPIAWEPHGVG